MGRLSSSMGRKPLVFIRVEPTEVKRRAGQYKDQRSLKMSQCRARSSDFKRLVTDRDQKIPSTSYRGQALHSSLRMRLVDRSPGTRV